MKGSLLRPLFERNCADGLWELAAALNEEPQGYHQAQCALASDLNFAAMLLPPVAALQPQPCGPPGAGAAPGLLPRSVRAPATIPGRARAKGPTKRRRPAGRSRWFLLSSPLSIRSVAHTSSCSSTAMVLAERGVCRASF